IGHHVLLLVDAVTVSGGLWRVTGAHGRVVDDGAPVRLWNDVGMQNAVTLADLTPPIALGPLDGRYRPVVAPLTDHLSEAALNRARLHVEVERSEERRGGRVRRG